MFVVLKARPALGYLSRQTPPRSHRAIPRCEAPRSRLSGVRDRLEAPDPLEDLLLRASRLAADFPQITEMDLNPVFCYPAGTAPSAVDVLMKVE